VTKNYISNKDETVRMFRSDFLDKFSRVHYSIPLFIYIPVILFFLYNSLVDRSLNLSQVGLLYAAGIIIWTITEYSLHRFIFHYTPKTKMGQRLHFIFHGVHHDYPKDSKRLVMPPLVSIPLASLFYLLYLELFGALYINPLFSGFMTGYIIYDMSHYAFHHLNSGNRLFLFLKKHHMKHHYQDATKGYGVSQPLWDSVMGTNFKSKNN